MYQCGWEKSFVSIRIDRLVCIDTDRNICCFDTDTPMRLAASAETDSLYRCGYGTKRSSTSITTAAHKQHPSATIFSDNVSSVRPVNFDFFQDPPVSRVDCPAPRQRTHRLLADGCPPPTSLCALPRLLSLRCIDAGTARRGRPPASPPLQTRPIHQPG